MQTANTGGTNYIVAGIIALFAAGVAAITVTVLSTSKLIVTEIAEPSSPSAGTQSVYIDSSDHIMKRKNSSGTVTSLGGSPGGSDTQVQFNDSSSFGGDSGLTFNKTTNALGIGGATTITGSADSVQLTMNGNATQTSNLVEYKDSSGNLRGAFYVAGSGNRGWFLAGAHNLFVGSDAAAHTIDGGCMITATGLFLRGDSGAISWASGTDPSGTIDLTLKRAAANVATATDGSGGQGWLQSAAGRKRLASDFTDNTATLANVTDLTFTVAAGRKYKGTLILKATDSTAAEGIKFDFDGGNATMTSFAAGASVRVGGTSVIGTATSTALATDLVFSTITNESWIYVDVDFVVNAAGTFIVRAAQNTHAAGTLTLSSPGTSFCIEDMP